MVRESRHLAVANLPENVNKDRVKEYFNRYGPVQSVRVLPPRSQRDGSLSATLQVAFIDITSALKARQSEHRFEDRILETDFYSPESTLSSSVSSSTLCTNTQDKSSPASSFTNKVDQRSSHTSSSYGRAQNNTLSDKFRGRSYHDDYRTNNGRVPRHQYRNSNFGQDTRNGLNGGNSSYRNNYMGWKDRSRQPPPDQYSSDKLDRTAASNKVNGVTNSVLEHPTHHPSASIPLSSSHHSLGGGGGGSGSNGPHHLNASLSGGVGVSGGSSANSATQRSRTTKSNNKKRHKSRSSDSCSNSSESRSGASRSSSASSSSRSSSSDSNTSKSRSPSSRTGCGLVGGTGGSSVWAKIQSSLGNYLPHTEFDKQCTIIVGNLPHRTEDGKLKDELNREYKKSGCSVRAIRIKSLPNTHRVDKFAIVTFSDPVDVVKAQEDSRNKRIFGSLIEAKKLLSSNDERPRDSELNEFHAKATRTLHVGNISREVDGDQVHDRFKVFGEILEIDIKKPDYALVQFVDIKSVINAIRNVDGELIAGQRVRLAFGPSVATKCVWCDGVGDDISEKLLTSEFAVYGKIQDLIIDRSRGHALVYFDQLKKATIAVMEMRGRSIAGCRLQTDYASHECRAAFFDHCKKSGMDVRERAKPWEQEQGVANERREGERLGRERSIDSRSSPVPPRSSRREEKTSARKGRDEYDEELRKFQSVREKFDDSDRCFTPPHRRAPPVTSRSPTPTSSRLGRSPGAQSRSSTGYDVRNESRTFSDRDSVVSEGSRAESPSLRDPFRTGRYVPRTQAISPPASESRHSSPAVVDDYDRQRRRYRGGEDSCDYNINRRTTHSSNNSSSDRLPSTLLPSKELPLTHHRQPTDPRVIEDTEPNSIKKVVVANFKCAGVDSGLSEDTSSGSSGSVPDVDNQAKLPSRVSAQPPRRISTDSVVSRSSAQGTDSRPSSPSPLPMIPVNYSANPSSLLRVVSSADGGGLVVTAAVSGGPPRTPSSPPPPDSDGSRPGTPLCDENPENTVCRASSGPVRLSSHVRTNSTSEPMSLPLPMFAQDVASTSPGDRRPSTERCIRPLNTTISPRDTTGPTTPVLNKSASKLTTPELLPSLGTSLVSPIKFGSGSTPAVNRDPRLKSPSIKSPGVAHSPSLTPGTPSMPLLPAKQMSRDFVAATHVVPVAKSIRSPQELRTVTNEDLSIPVLPSPGQSLLINVNTHTQGSDSRHRATPMANSNMTGLLAVAVPANQALASTPMSPGLMLSKRPKDGDKNKSNQNLDERIKTFNEQYEKWNGRVAGSGRSDTASRFNLDLKPNQPSAIVQKLLARKSVFDDDTKRLENQNEKLYDEKSGDGSSTPSYNTYKPGMVPASPAEPPSSPFNSPLPTTVNHIPQSYSTTPRDIPSHPLNVATVISCSVTTPVSSRISSPLVAASGGSGGKSSQPSPNIHHARSPGSASTPTTPSMSPRGGVSLNNRLMPGFFPSTPTTTQPSVSPVVKPSDDSVASPSPQRDNDKQQQQSTRPLPLPHKAGAPLPLPHKAGAAATTATVPIKPLVDKLAKTAAFTKPSAIVTPTLKSSALTSVRSSSVSSTKTVPTCTVVPSTNQQQPLAQICVSPAVEKGEASSTTCSPKLDTPAGGVGSLLHSKLEISTVEETDSDPNVTSTTKDLGVDKKLKHELVNPKDPIKIGRKDLDSLSYKDKKDIKEELFAPSILHSTPKLSKKYDPADIIKRDSSKKFKESSSHSKDKLKMKESLKHKHKMKHNNDLKDLFSATATIRKDVKKEERKEEVKRKEDEHHHSSAKDKKRRLSSNSEIEDTEPKSKHAKVVSKDDTVGLTTPVPVVDTEASRKQKLSAMGRIPKLEKTDVLKKEEQRSSKDKHRHSSSSNMTSSTPLSSLSTSISSKSKDKSRSEDKSRTDDKSDKHRHKDKERDKERSRNKHEEDKSKKSSSSSSYKSSKIHSLSADEDRSRKEKDAKKHKDKKERKEDRDSSTRKEHGDKDKSKDKEHRSSKDRLREKEKDKLKDKERRERKRKKEEEKKKVEEHQQMMKKQKVAKMMDDSSEEENSSDEERRKWSIFDEPADLHNPIYFSMYDKVKARRSCVKAREDEEARKQQEALDKFSKLKAQRLKREGKNKLDTSDEAMSDGSPADFKKAFSSGNESDTTNLVKKKKFMLPTSSDNEVSPLTAGSMEQRRRKKKVSSGSDRKSSSNKVCIDTDDSDTDHFKSVKTKASYGMIQSKASAGIFSSEEEHDITRLQMLKSASSSQHRKTPKMNFDTDSESNTEMKTASYLIKKEIKKEESKKLSDSDTEPEDNKSSALAVLTKGKKKSPTKELMDPKSLFVKNEPNSSDSEVDIKPVVSAPAPAPVQVKSEPVTVKVEEDRKKCIKVEVDKKKIIKKEKEKKIEQKPLMNEKMFATSSEDESFSANSKPPTPNTSSLKTSSITKPSITKMKVDQVFTPSEGEKDNLDSPALESDSDDDNQSRPPTPKFETSTKQRHEEVPIPATMPLTISTTTPAPKEDRKMSLFDSSDDEAVTASVPASAPEKKDEGERVRHLSAHDRMKQSENLFDKLLTVNVDESARLPKKSPGGTMAKSPGSAKSPGQRLAESQKSPGSHKSPLLSPGGKPTYLLAHAFNIRASKEAEKMHKKQEKDSRKIKVVDKKDATKTETVESKEEEDNYEIKIVEEKKAVPSAADNDNSSDVVIVATEEKSKDNAKKTVDEDNVSMKSIESEESSTIEILSESKPSKLKENSDTKQDTVLKDTTVVEKKEVIAEVTSVIDSGDHESDDDEGKLIIGEGDETSDADVVNIEEDETSKPSPSNSEEPEVIMEHISIKETKVPEIKTIDVDDKADVKEVKVVEDNTKSSAADVQAVKQLAASEEISTEVEQPARKAVISQEEEIQNAVNALLGESFDSFDTEDKAEVNDEVESMDVQESGGENVYDEAAQAVAGLGIASPEDQSNDWIQPTAAITAPAADIAEKKDLPAVEKQLPAVNVETISSKVTDNEVTKQAEESIVKPVMEEVVISDKTTESVEPAVSSVSTRGRRGRNASRGGARGGAKNVAERNESEAAIASITKPTEEVTRGGGRARGGRLGFGLTRGMARQEKQPVENKAIDVFEFQDEEDVGKTESKVQSATKEEKISPPPAVAEPIKAVVPTKGRKPVVKPPTEAEVKPAVAVITTTGAPSTISTPVLTPSKDLVPVTTTPPQPTAVVSKPVVVIATSLTTPISVTAAPIVQKPFVVTATVAEKPPVVISSTVAAAAITTPTTTIITTPITTTKSPEAIKPSRLRRSTGGKSRESEEEPADTEQEQKIKLILEQAKQEAAAEQAAAQQLVSAATNLTINHQGAAIPVSLSGFGSHPVLPQQIHFQPAVVVSTSSHQIQLKTGVPQPTVLPPRHDQQVRPQPQRHAAPVRPMNTMVPMSSTANMRPSLPIQFPTQPLPPKSLRKTQHVLLEQNQPPPPVSKNSGPNVVIPRSTIPISLPTEPIPRSVAMPVAGGARLVSMGGLPMTTMVALSTVASTRMMTTQSQGGMVAAPRLPLSLAAVSNVSRLSDLSYRMPIPISSIRTSSPITPVLTTVSKTSMLPVVSTMQLPSQPRTPQMHGNLPRKPIAAPRTSPSSEGLGLRVALKQRELTSELSDVDKMLGHQQPMALDLASSSSANINTLAKKEYLQPRDIELTRPSSTPVQSHQHPESMMPPKEEEKILYQQQLDQLEMLKLRQIMFNQLLQAGWPEQAALQALPNMLREAEAAQAANAAKHSPIPSQVQVMHQHQQHHEDERRQPLPAHVPYRQTDSPMYHVTPTPAHSNSQLSYHVRDHGLHAPPSHQDVYGRPPADITSLLPPAAHSGQIKRLSHSAGVADFSLRSQPPQQQQHLQQHQQSQPLVETEKAAMSMDLMTSYRMPHLAAYPICWTGILGLKNDMANVQMHFVSGDRDLALEFMPETGANMKIVQRMRLEDQQIEGVKKKMETKSEHCLLLALPHGNDQDQFEAQSRILRNNFITYLQLKSAAGIANVTNKDGQPAIVHVFPSCDFANENLARIAPNLLARVAEIEHLVIVIATVFNEGPK